MMKSAIQNTMRSAIPNMTPSTRNNARLSTGPNMIQPMTRNAVGAVFENVANANVNPISRN